MGSIPVSSYQNLFCVGFRNGDGPSATVTIPLRTHRNRNWADVESVCPVVFLIYNFFQLRLYLINANITRKTRNNFLNA